MPEAIALAQKLGGVGFPTLLVLILIGSYYQVWVWGRELRKMEESRDKWESIAFQATGLAEDSVGIAKRKIPRNVS
jgi:hypothetical protein